MLSLASTNSFDPSTDQMHSTPTFSRPSIHELNSSTHQSRTIDFRSNPNEPTWDKNESTFQYYHSLIDYLRFLPVTTTRDSFLRKSQTRRQIPSKLHSTNHPSREFPTCERSASSRS